MRRRPASTWALVFHGDITGGVPTAVGTMEGGDTMGDGGTADGVIMVAIDKRAD